MKRCLWASQSSAVVLQPHVQLSCSSTDTVEHIPSAALFGINKTSTLRSWVLEGKQDLYLVNDEMMLSNEKSKVLKTLQNSY